MARPKMRLGEFLISRNLITRQNLTDALEYQKKHGGRLGWILVMHNLITEEKLLSALKYHLEIPILDLETIVIDSNVLKLVPKKLAERHSLLPVKIITSFGKKTLLVVMSNPMDIEAINEVEFAAGTFVQPVLAKERDLMRALNRYYGIETGHTYTNMERGGVSENQDDMIIITGGKQFSIYEERSSREVTEEDKADTDTSNIPTFETPDPALDADTVSRNDRVEFEPEGEPSAAPSAMRENVHTTPASSDRRGKSGSARVSDLERLYASLSPASKKLLVKIIITQLVRQKKASLNDIEKWFQDKS
ncbi:MAG: hypothetical protein JW885_03725 [Deltaproteobacteria bacterium]|nr:hypothetical protein [Candidatus Zymogenaceae bacterium]